MDERKDFIYDNMRKAQERRRLLLLREGVTDKQSRSVGIARRALELLHGNVMVYVSIGSEVDTHYLIDELFKRGFNVYAPYTVGGIITPRSIVKTDKPNKIGNLPENCYGLTEDSPKIDCCVTPLLGFNEKGYRIGYGMGCYDRFFLSNSAVKIGLAFECQRTNFLPDTGDIPLDCCVTEKNVIYF